MMGHVNLFRPVIEAVLAEELNIVSDRLHLVRCKLLTGRTHQIRVHLLSLGHPIVADKMYCGRARLTLGDVVGAEVEGGEEVLIERQALHAHLLEFTHPTSGALLRFQSEPPADFGRALAVIEQYRSKRGTEPARRRPPDSRRPK
jgi:23S rRNA pseudouridine1911/1915/1917 synthase